MGKARDKDVLSCIQDLEMRVLGCKGKGFQETKEDKELACQVKSLLLRKNQLKVQIQRLKEAKDALDKCQSSDGNALASVTSRPQLFLPLLMVRQTQLKTKLQAHHLIGGYDVVELDGGQRLCFSLSTTYEDTYLDTYHLELNLAKGTQILRHDIPPSIPLKALAQELLQDDLPRFLHTLQEHVSGLACRQHQLKLLQQQVASVKVMESNPLHSRLVLMCKIPNEETTVVLLSLHYGDPVKILPTQVTLESNEPSLFDAPSWRNAKSLLLISSPHNALLAMQRDGMIL